MRAAVRAAPQAAAQLVGLPAGLLAKAVGAAYGSFNFVVFRKELRADDPATAEAALEAQNALLREMRAPVGRARPPSGATRRALAGHAEWAAVAADAGSRLVEEWNSRTIGECCDSMEAWVARLRGACVDAAPDLALRALDFELDKKAKILRSIVDADGRQTCFADTLVAALVDDGAPSRRTTRSSRPPTAARRRFEPRSSPLSALAAAKARRRKRSRSRRAACSAPRWRRTASSSPTARRPRATDRTPSDSGWSDVRRGLMCKLKCIQSKSAG